MLKELTAKRDLATYKKYAAFPAMILLKPQRGGCGKDGQRNAIVNAKLKLFNQNKLDLLWSYVVEHHEEKLKATKGGRERERTAAET